MINIEKEVLKTDISEYPLFNRGKVRDVYEIDSNLLIVTTDRLSAFDVIMPNGIPERGKLLTQMSLFWFDFLKSTVDSHLISGNVDDLPEALHQYREMLEDRIMLVKKAERIDIECIVRGYISGSMWKELLSARENGENEVHGFPFPPDLKESDKLPEPIFTPSTKADSGHDENISFAKMVDVVGQEVADLCRNKSIEIYTKAADYALTKGIIIADTKFEFGFIDGKFSVIDEVLSPDSSRFWPLNEYQPGGTQPSFDKQIVRNYLGGLDWDKTPPGPKLPDEIVEKTAARYNDVAKLLME